jgi:endogenous inhibitor of DNA gyrase (YacG/DUF329 family)
VAKVETFKCDQCGKQKQETNHWYAIDWSGVNRTVYRWSDAPSLVTLKHLCGQACVVAELNSWMNEERV